MINQPEVETQPSRPPGECFSCKATQLSPGRVWFLDTDVDYFDTPSYRIQICNICFDILANKCGYIKIGEEVEQYKKKIAGLEGQIHELDNYRRYIDFLGINPSRLDTLMGLSTSNLEAESPDAGESRTEKRVGKNSDSGSVGSGETGLSESTDDKRMGKLRPSNESGVHVNI